MSKTQNNFLLSILESLPHPFIVVDAKERTITLANSTAQKEWFKEGVCCNSPEFQNTRPYLCNGNPCPVTAVTEAKKPVMMKHCFTHEQGDIKTHKIHAFPVFDTIGNVKQVIVYILDITDIENSKLESQRLSKVVQQSSDSILIMNTAEPSTM